MAQVKHATCSARAGSIRPAWASPASPCPSSTRPSMATIRRRRATGLPPGEANASFPEIAFAGPNAPTQWRGTDARAFTEYLNNYTLQDNLSWTSGRHAMTFGFQGQRMDAQRARAGLRQPRDVRVQQRADRRVRSDRHTAVGHGQRLRQLPPRRPERHQRHRGLAGRHQRPLLHLRVLGPGRRQAGPGSHAQSRAALRHHEALHRGLRSLVVPRCGAAECRRRRLSRRRRVRRRWLEQLRLPHSDQDLLRGGRPASRPRLQRQRAGWSCAVRYGINYSRRGAVGGRAGARNGTGTLGLSANASFPSANGFDPSYNWNNGVPSYPAPPFFDPTLNAGFVVGRGTGGGVTFGDPEIGGRPPRYQNWNAGLQYALAQTLTVGATYAGSRGDFLGSSGRGFYSNQLDPRFLVLGNLLTQQATPANVAAAQAIMSGVVLPTPDFRARSARCCGRSRSIRRSRCLRERGALHLPLAAAHAPEAALGRRPDREFQLHLQPDRRQSNRPHRL